MQGFNGLEVNSERRCKILHLESARVKEVKMLLTATAFCNIISHSMVQKKKQTFGYGMIEGGVVTFALKEVGLSKMNL